MEFGILVPRGTGVPYFPFDWNWSATLVLGVELECQIPLLLGRTEMQIFLYMELECHISLATHEDQSQRSDLGLAAFFSSLELECGTGVRVEFGSPVPVNGCVTLANVSIFASARIYF